MKPIHMVDSFLSCILLTQTLPCGLGKLHSRLPTDYYRSHWATSIWRHQSIVGIACITHTSRPRLKMHVFTTNAF
ncbi:hypothetical protein V8C42DRAFT_335342 [Trichoderma barbatum]